MKKNSIVLGVLFGAIAPLLAYLLTNYTELQKSLFSDKPIAFYVLAALINLIAVRFIFRTGNQYLAKGIVLVTFLSMILLVILTKLKV